MGHPAACIWSAMANKVDEMFSHCLLRLLVEIRSLSPCVPGI